MTIYAFFMTLIVGMFVGSYLTIAIHLHMQKMAQEKAKKLHPASLEETADEIIRLVNP